MKMCSMHGGYPDFFYTIVLSTAGMEPSAPQFVDVQRWEMDVPWPMTVGTLLVRPAFYQAFYILIM
jgi:hypothetical protein